MLKDLIKKYKMQIIYIEAIVYMFLITVVIFASIQSNIYFRFIPLTFILGMVGVYIFDKKMVTSIFGFCISVCVLKLTFYKSFDYTLIYSLYLGISILLGELLGGFLKNTQMKYKSDKNPKSIIFAVIVLVLGMYLNAVVNGNIFSFLSSEKILNNYLEENYSKYDFKLIPERYIYGEYNMYSFKISGISDVNYIMSVTSDGKVIDKHYDEEKEKLDNKLQEKLNKIDLSNYENYDIDLKYNDLKTLTLYITNEENDMDMLVKKADEILLYFLNNNEFDHITKLIIINNDSIGDIDKIYFHDLNYYINSLNKEVILD